MNIKSTPATFVDVSAMRVNICMKVYTTVKQRNVYTLSPNLLEIYLKITKRMLFQQRQPPFLSVPSVVFASSVVVALKRAG